MFLRTSLAAGSRYILASLADAVRVRQYVEARGPSPRHSPLELRQEAVQRTLLSRSVQAVPDLDLLFAEMVEETESVVCP